MTLGIMFHHFHNSLHPSVQGSINQDTFELILHHLKKKYRILRAQEYYKRFLQNRLEENEICLTFDDGLLCQWDVALPILNKLGLTGFWFIYSSVFNGDLEKLEIYRFFRNTFFENIEDFYQNFFEICLSGSYLIEDEKNKFTTFNAREYLQEFKFYSINDKKFRFMRDDILKKMRYENIMDFMLKFFKADPKEISKKLWLEDKHLKLLHAAEHIIGLHSYSHPTRLNELNKEKQFEEYSKNFSHIKNLTKSIPTCVAHPCNSYNDTTLDVLKCLGIKLGFRSNRAMCKFSDLEYPRIDHADLLPAEISD